MKTKGKILGAFVLEDDGDGCLTGKYFNNTTCCSFPEFDYKKKQAADIEVTPVPAPESDSAEEPDCPNEEERDYTKFIGTYESTWIEGLGQPHQAELMITFQRGTLYRLEWTGPHSHFVGHAMQNGNQLVGYYWDMI